MICTGLNFCVKPLLYVCLELPLKDYFVRRRFVKHHKFMNLNQGQCSVGGWREATPGMHAGHAVYCT